MRYPHTRTGFDLMIPYEKKKRKKATLCPIPQDQTTRTEEETEVLWPRCKAREKMRKKS
jgi:hypothetical protein